MSKKVQQKLLGVMAIALGVISIIGFKDGTYALFIMPMGLWCLFTKERVF